MKKNSLYCWIILSVLVVLASVKVAQAAPLLNDAGNQDLETNLQARGFIKYLSKKFGKSRTERGESSTQRHDAVASRGHSPARASVASENSESTSSDSSVGKASSSEESDSESVVGGYTERPWHNRYEDQIAEAPHVPYRLEYHFRGAQLAALQGHHSDAESEHHSEAQETPPIMSAGTSRNTSPAGSAAPSHNGSPASSPSHSSVYHYPDYSQNHAGYH